MSKQTQEALKIIESAEWLANKIVAFSDYGKEAALRLRQLSQMQREALEQPAQEPVAWMQTFINQKINEQAKIKHAFSEIRIGLNDVPLYTHPHQWQGLTDDEIQSITWKIWGADALEPELDFARAIEQAFKEKNI